MSEAATGGAVNFRLLGASDIPSVHALWAASGLPFHPEGRDAPALMGAEIEAGSAFLIGAFDGDALVGVVLGTDDGRKGWVNRLAVRPDRRGEGLGGRLIERCETVFAERGRGIVACLIEDWNDASLALFQKSGYALRRDILYLRKMPRGEGW